MRASRLLRILLLLQNRGKLTSVALAEELEVTPRTILRDVEALEEAGLPMVVTQGHQGGIELGFNVRTRLTGLSHEEAEALAVVLFHPTPALEELGMTHAGKVARSKLIESFPDAVRERLLLASRRFQFEAPKRPVLDPRIAVLAEAIRGGKRVRLQYASPKERLIHPIGLRMLGKEWAVIDARYPKRPIPKHLWGDINISGLRFDGLKSQPRRN
jgi:predicted DNA-binding transcriptional regulator YafY